MAMHFSVHLLHSGKVYTCTDLYKPACGIYVEILAIVLTSGTKLHVALLQLVVLKMGIGQLEGRDIALDLANPHRMTVMIKNNWLQMMGLLIRSLIQPRLVLRGLCRILPSATSVGAN